MRSGERLNVKIPLTLVVGDGAEEEVFNGNDSLDRIYFSRDTTTLVGKSKRTAYLKAVLSLDRLIYTLHLAQRYDVRRSFEEELDFDELENVSSFQRRGGNHCHFGRG